MLWSSGLKGWGFLFHFSSKTLKNKFYAEPHGTDQLKTELLCLVWQWGQELPSHLSRPSSPRGKSLTCQGRGSAERNGGECLIHCAILQGIKVVTLFRTHTGPSPPQGTPRTWRMACLRVRWRCPAGPAAGSPGGACAHSRCCLPGSRSRCQRTVAGRALPLGPSLHISDRPSKQDKNGIGQNIT